MVELWAYGICQTQILTGTKFILLVYRLMTLWTQDIRTLNDRRGRKISDLTNSACTWSRYIPCLVLLILLWNSFFWPSRASGSRKCTGWYQFGFVSNINTLPINTSTHRQTHGKYFIWSGGYTIGACDNITFTS